MTDVLAQRVQASPDATALLGIGGVEWTYCDLDERVEQVAGRLAALGVAGEHLGCLLETRPATVVLVHAAARLGCVLVPLNTRLTPAELDRQVERAELAALVCGADTADTAVELSVDVPTASVDDTEHADVTALDSVSPAEFAPATREVDEPAVMLATSGTTGEPKLVVLTTENLRASAVASAFRLGVTPDDRWLDPLAVYHMGGLAPIVRSALYGTTVVVPGEFDAETTLDALERFDCTGISLVPTMLRRLLDAGSLADSLRFVLLGGAPASEELVERCEKRDVPVHPTYGMTETASQVATARPGEAFAYTGTVGRPLLGTDLSVLDGDGRPVDIGETGELVVSGPTVFAGYYNDPDATARAFSDRGFHTGDVGHHDAGGRLWVTGRRDEMISTGGELVAPSEIARVLRSHPAIDDAGVVGLPDPDWGERVGALVVGDVADDEAIRNYCRERLAGFKLPRTIAFADELPRTASGTVERAAVRERLLDNGD
ncbi:o-succinylbenzoate--CoA ligase [Halococcus thailandensis]|uniref:O-succinylbenzoate-CoA ligase n=1 Tax=Halococcus thailandensis JCM 13552 TaxID=1227457 RepID=M0N1L5_9EURY|nr:o-succinylbenzoate--CoA ligase [Halococcus thailandensis]EMA51862.1 o-succinylbenzoate-CoA ligase [Halococcus thailandensis JCM 13552]